MLQRGQPDSNLPLSLFHAITAGLRVNTCNDCVVELVYCHQRRPQVLESCKIDQINMELTPKETWIVEIATQSKPRFASSPPGAVIVLASIRLRSKNSNVQQQQKFCNMFSGMPCACMTRAPFCGSCVRKRTSSARSQCAFLLPQPKASTKVNFTSGSVLIHSVAGA